MRILALIGEPATGKSTIAKKLISRLSKAEPLSQGLVRGTIHKQDKVIIFGIYEEGQTFGGTDRLSMAVQPEAEVFVKKMSAEQPDWAIFFEGDRLGNVSFIRVCQAVAKTTVLLLDVPKEEKNRRHSVRKDDQSAKFLASRRTKVENIFAQIVGVRRVTNESIKDSQYLTDGILSFLRGDN